MARLIFGMQQSLDGYVDHLKMGPPDATVFRYFIERIEGLTCMIYGSRIYGIMRYWDTDPGPNEPAWDADRSAFAAAWRSKPKWVASHSLTAVGPNATLIDTDLATFVRKLKTEQTGNIDVAGPVLAASLTELGLLDEYHVYLRGLVLGSGQPMFAKPLPRLNLAAIVRIGDQVARLTYVPDDAASITR